jgi:hypothetical protein
MSATPAESERPEFGAGELLRWQEAGAKLGSSPSPFYAALFGRFAADCERGACAVADLLARAPMTINAASPLRLMGGVHRGVRAGAFPALAEAWPTEANPTGNVDDAYVLLQAMFEDPPAVVLEALTRDPQTNEVGRSAALALGLAAIGRRTGLPLRLFEIGSSAGLNLRVDSYFCDGGASTWGPASSALRFGADSYTAEADFSGATPIVERRGCDIHPIDATNAEGAATLMSYVWPDQLARLDRLERALKIARDTPVTIDTESADVWVDRHVATAPATATVLMHSVMWQYMPDAVQHRITATMQIRGARATVDAPLALLAMEPGPAAVTMDLSLTLWPDGERRVLAHCGGHGPPIDPLEESWTRSTRSGAEQAQPVDPRP